MTLKSTVLLAGFLLGVGVVTIAALTGPSFALFVLPRDAEALRSYQQVEQWRTTVSAVGALLAVGCMVLIVFGKRKSGKNPSH